MASVLSSLVQKYELLCKRKKWKKLGAVGFNFRRDGFSCGLGQHFSAELEINIDWHVVDMHQCHRTPSKVIALNVPFVKDLPP
ncbi:uncharacterized protein PITG_14665 [Phytophthora infestans T30-4]|uniref:Uncharacterized protein n=1 Tax=Phytophthora infestans (strain T30-4) TaxID=403677 RepID=D0NQT3_PHYIT|nr:uncharacterized protein PITG_14665 [Phytophthora infestans T30-4]EEY63031.1 hypothetical protein PITG_14665 [Phytophthora infestans T30-4]|eukprot:XP_002898554.1 hypothetical protein PITG_14665 [Phytophthora infestans T30-4]